MTKDNSLRGHKQIHVSNEWFLQAPANAEQLQSRLISFRKSCDTLIAAPHPQLSAEDREWLVEKCKIWADKLDEQIAKLQNSEKMKADIESARTASDEIVLGLIKALRGRNHDRFLAWR